MGWALGYDSRWNRDIGYGVPAECDQPQCKEQIDRGLSYVCGSEPYGGDHGCGLYFCSKHLSFHKPRGSDCLLEMCPRCVAGKPWYKHAKPDVREWIEWKLTDESWYEWRQENPAKVAKLKAAIS